VRWTWPTVLYAVGAALLVTMVVHVVALVVRGGAVTGPVSLRKPADFAETGWLTCWLVAATLPHVQLSGWQRHLVGTSVVAFGVGETTVMAVQAWRGVPSHYNVTTTFDAILVRGVAAGLAGLFLVGTVVLLVATWRAPRATGSLLLGIRGGIAALLLGCIVGFVMISNMSGVFQGSVGSAFGHPLVGYAGPSAATVGREYVLLRPYTRGGDLVLLHAIGVHGLLLVTGPALLLDRTRLAEPARLRLVAAVLAGTALVLAVLAVQAVRQLPLVDLGPVSWVLLVVATGAGVAGWAGSVAAFVRGRRAGALT
jgi:hypothetical protein